MFIKMQIKIFLILTLLQISFSAFCLTTDTDDISNRKYFPAVKKLIQEAQKEIKISIYYMALTSKGPVSELLNELVNAKKRGVDIEIVLDWDSSPEVFNKEDIKNVKAFSFLKRNDLKVFYDDNKALNHSKYLVIDKEILVVGSHNWSANAFNSNHESTLVVRSKELAAIYLQYFKDLPKVLPAPVKGAIPLPAEFVKNQNLGPRMVQKSDTTLFDLYLLCQKLSFEQKSREIKITDDQLKENFFRKKNLRLAGKSIRSYFIHSYLKRRKTWQTFIESWQDNKTEKLLLLTLQKQNEPEADSLMLSELYWKDYWFERLEDRAKFLMLYFLSKTRSGAYGRTLQISQNQILKDSGIHLKTLSTAATELTRYNLIERQIQTRPDAYIPNTYTLNDFYVYADFEKNLQKIKNETDPALFEIAAKICDITHEPNDIHAIQKVIAIGKKHGTGTLQKAWDTANESAVTSASRHFGYLMGMIESIGHAG